MEKMKGVFQQGGYWYARIDGKRVYCGKGDKGRKLAEVARKKYDVKKYENREVNANLKVKRYDTKTVKDLLSWYLAIASVQKKRAYQRKVNAADHLFKYFGKKQIAEVEADDIEHYRLVRVGQGAAHATVNVEVKLLGTAYRTGIRRKKIPASSLPGEFPLVEDHNPRPLITDEQFEKLLEHADADFADVLICGYESAMRLGEIGKLTAGQVKLGVRYINGVVADYIDLGIFDTKNKTRRTVPVSARLKEVLQKRMRGLELDDYVFKYSDTMLNHALIKRLMTEVCNKAGIAYGDKTFNAKGERIGVVFHCLRHSRTSKWVTMGFSDEIIRRATGHRSLEAYRSYIKLDPSAMMPLVSARHKNDTKTLSTVENKGF